MALEKNIEQLIVATVPGDDDLIYVAQGGLDRAMTRANFLTGITAGTDIAIADVTGLQGALDAKAPTAHTHAQADITGLATTLSGKAPLSHSHTTAEVTGLDTALAGKAASSHNHANATTAAAGFMSPADKTKLDGITGTSGPVAIADVTGLQSALDAKAPDSHTHTTAQVTGLDTALAGKASTSHTHAAVTTSVDGFMSAADKTKLDGIQAGATAGGGSAGTFATELQARAGTDATTYMSPLRTHQAIDEYAADNELTGTDAQVVGFDASGNAVAVNNMRSMMVAVVAEDQTLAAGDGKRTFRQAIALNLREVELFTPTGGSTTTTVDIVVNGTTILATPLSITGGSSVATRTTFANASIPKGATVRIDVDAAGTGAKGLWVNFSGIAA